MTKREPFAKLSGTLGYIEIAGCWLVPTTNTVWPSAFVSKINAAHDKAVREAVAERDARIEILEAQEAVRGGEFCAESRSRGRDMCGTCAWCVNFFKQKYELASARIAELERALVHSGLAFDEILHELGIPGEDYPAPVSNAVDFAKEAFAEIKSVLGEKEAKP